ncbi:hypothetical protein LEP1GSC047_1670 [Leptospira inadai serovar Lyme str. 10]|uniref:Rod shape-determining protein MreD n=2 Tax=Leptospira inadai serovar Lyme TaxID=293084 RepID=V6H869_9LEPT|nr:DUF6580 family putative transport protein [Leptospira inadai]EQA34847.1 hypothetical protein LEP1GSC047_1670 [Leptospira inadai serovar Lyme str. 10]PNV72582.1 hypothetical protein BES34_019065 [Leptospira inadai serovar Lyme]
MTQSRNIVAVVLLALAVLSRFLPHLPNFTPILAISLFGGVYFTNRWVALLLPLGIMMISDAVIGFHSLVPVVYGMFILFAIAGRQLRENLTVGRLAITGFGGSVLFFLVTNFFVWLTSGMYSLDFGGFVTCYVAAIPFFQNSLLGDLVYIPLLFGSFYLMERSGVVPAEQAA